MKPLHAALLGIGALYLFSQQKASAATGKPVVTGSIQAPSIPAYLRTPAAAAQYASYGQGRSLVPAQGTSPVTAGLNFLTALVNGGSAAGSYASSFNAQNLGTGRSAEMDQNLGESQARSYYADHASEFQPDPINYALVNATPWAQDAINDPTDY